MTKRHRDAGLNPSAARGALALALVAALLALSGCQSTARGSRSAAGTQPVADASVPVSDPCADRLHEVSGALLMYVLGHGQLPPTLSALEADGEVSSELLNCPLSRRPYAYNLEGLHLPGRKDRLIMYDAAPVHDGHRWGIVMSDPKDAGPRTAEVIAVPENVLREILEGRAQR
jgi:hypothetical protein